MRIKNGDIIEFIPAPGYFYKVLKVVKQSKLHIDMWTLNSKGEKYFYGCVYDKRDMRVVPKLEAILRGFNGEI